MDMADVLYNGNNQIINIPNKYHIDSNKVYVNKIGDLIMLIPADKAKESFLSSFDMFSADFMSDGRYEEVKSKRELL